MYEFIKIPHMRYVLFCLALFLVAGCSKHYTSEKIGWTITLPGKTWEVIIPKEGENVNAKTKEEVGEFIFVKIDGSRVQELISFRKNNTSSFVSVIETYNNTSDGQYEQLLLNQHEALKAINASKNIPAKYEIGATRIGGVMIDWFNIITYTPGSEKPPHTRRIFSCLVNKYILSMVISSDNKKDMETLENVVYSSEFSIKYQSQ
jgi:hypothetical protein